MAQQIVVPMRGSDSIEQLLPYIEEVAQPGMKVVFYIHCSVKGFKPLIELLLSVHAGMIDPSFLPGRTTQDVFEQKKDTLRREVLLTCQRFTRKGIEIGVTFYTGRGRRVLSDCMANEDVHLVVMRPKGSQFLRQLLHALGPLARVIESPFCSPVLLLHPHHTARRWR